MYLHFGPLIHSNKLGELAKLKQSRSVSEYQTQFKALAYRAGFLSQTQNVQLYISGLQDYIAVEVELHHLGVSNIRFKPKKSTESI